MSGHHSKNSKQTHSPLKTVLRKIGDRYQAYCATYKTHIMGTCHGGTGGPIDRDINLYIEDMEGINTGQTMMMRVPVGQTLPLPLEDQRQMATPAKFYPATKSI